MLLPFEHSEPRKPFPLDSRSVGKKYIRSIIKTLHKKYEIVLVFVKALLFL